MITLYTERVVIAIIVGVGLRCSFISQGMERMGFGEIISESFAVYVGLTWGRLQLFWRVLECVISREGSEINACTMLAGDPSVVAQPRLQGYSLGKLSCTIVDNGMFLTR